MTSSGYLLANAEEPARRRLAAISALFDDFSTWRVRRAGCTTGWRCWEVGAGSRSMPDRLAELTGPEGRVLATDLDLSVLGAEGRDGPVEVRRHDVVADPLPDERFDLVHARLLLTHLPERQTVVARLASCVAPGGLLLLEDADPALQPLACLDEAVPGAALANRIRRGFRSMLAERGAELDVGRRLPRLAEAAGLVVLGTEAFFPVGRPDCAELELATVDSVGAGLLERHVVSADELAAHREAVRSGRLPLAQPPLCSTLARR